MIKRCLSILLAVLLVANFVIASEAKTQYPSLRAPQSGAKQSKTISQIAEPVASEAKQSTNIASQAPRNDRKQMSIDIKQAKSLPIIDLRTMRLKGTAISGIFKPIAIIEDINTMENRWFMVGDTLCGGRIADIQRGYLVLEISGTLYQFGLPEGSAGGAIAGTVSGSGVIAPGERIDESTWKVKLDSAIDMLANVSGIMKDARIKPYFAIGKAAGIKIDRIRAGSVISEMGLEEGDVLKGVNGFGVMTPARLFDAYRKYRNKSLIQLQLIRNEEPVTLTYNIVK